MFLRKIEKYLPMQVLWTNFTKEERTVLFSEGIII